VTGGLVSRRACGRRANVRTPLLTWQRSTWSSEICLTADCRTEFQEKFSNFPVPKFLDPRLTRQTETADCAPGVAIWVVTLSARIKATYRPNVSSIYRERTAKRVKCFNYSYLVKLSFCLYSVLLPCCGEIKLCKNSPVRPSACNLYYCTHSIAKPVAVCTLRFSWAAKSSNHGLWANLTSLIKRKIRSVSLRHQRRIEPRP